MATSWQTTSPFPAHCCCWCLDQRERWTSTSYILLEWIIQSLSHAAVNHTPKGGLLQCAQERCDPRGAGYLSTPGDQSLPADRLTPSPSTSHSSALAQRGYVCGVWPCESMCVWGRASLCPWTMVALEVPQRRGTGAGSRPPLTVLPSLHSLPCSSNYITCPMSFYFGNKGEGSKGEAKYWSA